MTRPGSRRIASGSSTAGATSKIGAAVSDSLLRFYLAFVPRERIRYETGIPAAHGFPTLTEGGPCDVDESPWILACNYDGAGEMLRYLYDGLVAPAGKIAGELREFGQARYVERESVASMADDGFVFVPKDCASGKPCRIHVVFHGCRQGIGELGRAFAREAGYNRWADANRIVVLYPQAERASFRRSTPAAAGTGGATPASTTPRETARSSRACTARSRLSAPDRR